MPDVSDGCPSSAGELGSGCPAPLRAEVRQSWRVSDLLSQLVSLRVRAPTGSRIVLTCHAKQGACGFDKRTIASTKTADTSLTRDFKGRRIFSAKAKIVVRVTHRGRRGTYERSLTRTGRHLPSVIYRCLDPNDAVKRCT
ncbi:MAG: hypothetical protein QOJ46_1286 [bacterium]